MSKTSFSQLEPSNRSLRTLIIVIGCGLAILTYGAAYLTDKKHDSRESDVLEWDVAEAEVTLQLAQGKSVSQVAEDRLTAATLKLQQTLQELKHAPNTLVLQRLPESNPPTDK